MTDTHRAEVARLVAEGWSTHGFRKAIVRTWMAPLVEHGDASKADCTKTGNRCRCRHDELEPDCHWRDAWDNIPSEPRSIPDAYRIDVSAWTVWIAEVDVSTRTSVHKWADWWAWLDCEGWTLRVVIVDREGNRSEPWSNGAMFRASSGMRADDPMAPVLMAWAGVEERAVGS